MPCARRAGHDQTHERMKKIMKKFLSSLLALTMILSLVIVPANADDKYEYRLANGASVSVTADKSTVDGNETVTFTATPNITVERKNETDNWTTYSGTDVEFVYSWDGASGNNTQATASWEAASADSVKTVTCTVTVKKVDGNSTIDSPVEGSAQVTVKAAPQLIYVDGLSLTAKVGGNEVGRTGVKEGDVVSLEVTGTPRVKLGTNGEATEAAATAWTWTGVSSSTNTASWTADATAASKTISCNVTVTSNGKTVDVPLRVTIPVTALTLSITGNVEKVSGSYEVLKGGRLELTASSTGVENPNYKWYNASGNLVGTGDTFVLTSAATVNTTRAVTLTCKVFSGDNETPVKDTTCTYTIVDENVRLTLNKESVTLSKKGAYEDITASVINWGTNRAVTGTVKYTFAPSKRNVVTLSSTENTTGATRITLDANGDVTITVEATYKGKTLDAKTIYVTGELLSASLDKVENGDKLEFDYSDLKAAANEALPSRVSVKSSSYINLSGVPTKADEGGLLYYGSNKVSASGRNVDVNDDLEFRAADGFIGDATMTMTVTGDDNNTYVITLTIPVTSAGDIKETVTGSSANSSVSFDVDDVVDYGKVYIRGSVSGSSSSRTFTPSSLASSNYDGYWDGNTKSGSGWVLFDDDDTVTIPASAFSKTTGKVTLYVVGLSNKDVAYTGTIEVSQKSYTIEYNVVAGDSVDFKQADFDDFVKTYAYDNDDRYSSRNDDIEISYVTFSLPSASTEGTLYEGKSKIARNDKIEDVDDVTFESVAKAKGTISIGFTAYGKIYKDGYTSKANTKEFDYSGTVVISVVNEDIVYEVGVNSSVKFDSSHFQSFLNTSSKRATLDYVTFDVGSNKAVTSYFSGTGALYRYYSAYGVNSTVDSKDEFYYNPKSSSKNYDLDDVTYVTSRFAKTGDIVYIPFTAYGTRNEKAEGTVAIKVKQTMNFVDVHTYDYFYDAVQWAVNLDITKGTSTTTFSPKTGCTRAQIVTFLWRAAHSPEPRSNSNKFTDVSATKHADYMKAILWATEQGITTGTGNNKFSPDATCTRAQIVTFLYRFKNTPPVYGSLNFTDVSKTTHSAYYNAILWASNNKIATGYNNIFDPNGTCNRGDAVTFLYRALA